MKFFRDVVSHLIKNAFEAHTQFSVADDTAVGDNPVRSISLDATPASETDSIILLSWEGGTKLFEKTLPEQEAAHQFDLISTDLAEVASLTKQGQYDAAKDLMKKLGQKYAENTGEIVPTNLPKLHNTQASQETLAFDTEQMEEELREAILDAADQINGVPQTKAAAIARDLYDYFPRNSDVIKYIENFIGNEFDLRHYVEDILMEAEEGEDIISSKNPDNNLLKKAKITMQNLWFSTTDELLDYQKKQKGAQPGAEKNVPLWDQQKKAPKPNTDLAPASLSYEDAEKEQEKDHEDIQKHIDEQIKTELESALQEKAASVFGPDQIELIKVLRKNGRNWDEIKKILVKDFGFDKDSTNIFVDEQRQSLDPAGIDVEPVKEEEKPLTPPENLVSPETHDKLLQDHEDKKKDNSPLKEPSFTPKDVMDIPEDEEIQDQSALYANEIARADNGEIHKMAAPSDTNPLQEPLKEAPTTPNQDTIPMGKSKDHNAPQHGDRVFVSSDLTGEKAGFEATFLSTFQSKGTEYSIVQTDEGDMLEVESHRVSRTAPASGPQDSEPITEPIIEQPKEQDIPVAPKQSDLTTMSARKCEICGEPTHKADAELCSACEEGMKEASLIKAEIEKLASLVKDADDEQLTMWDERSYDEKYPMMAKHPELVDYVEAALKKFPDAPFRVEQELFDHAPGYMWISSAARSREGGDLISEVKRWMQENEQSGDKVWVPRKYEQVESAKTAELPAEHVCEQCKQPMGYQGFLSPICEKCVRKNHKKVTGSDFEKGISQNKTADCTRCEADGGCGGLGYGCKCGCHLTPEERNASLKQADNKIMTHCDKCKAKFYGTPDESECPACRGVDKKAADPTEAPKTQFKDYKITPKYTPKEQAIPASPELGEVLSKMEALQQNLATLTTAREQITAKLQAEMKKIDDEGQRAQMEAALQETIEKAGVLVNAVESKVVQWKDKLYTLQTEEIQYVPKLTQKELLAKIYEKFAGAEKYVKDVLNGMLSQAKTVTEKTLVRWPNKKSDLNVENDSNIFETLNNYNAELLEALKLLSSPL